MKEWYNGYRFGDTEIYNPWSLMNSVRDGGIQQPYWKHTSRNGLVLEALKNLTDISPGIHQEETTAWKNC